MVAKATPEKTKRKNTSKISKASPPLVTSVSTRSVITQNLINMVAVTAVSGTVLLGLLAAKHF
jgi:hypothetical protein